MFFHFPKRPAWSGARIASYLTSTQSGFAGLRRRNLKADLSPPSSVEVKWIGFYSKIHNNICISRCYNYSIIRRLQVSSCSRHHQVSSSDYLRWKDLYIYPLARELYRHSESTGSSNSLLKLYNSHAPFHAYIRVSRRLLSYLWFYMRLPFHTVLVVAKLCFCLIGGGGGWPDALFIVTSFVQCIVTKSLSYKTNICIFNPYPANVENMVSS
jgi:hypothetical protein